MSVNSKETFTGYIHDLQDRICAQLEALDGATQFVEDQWERPGGGGGRSRVISNGNVFEKGGVSTSIVHGDLPPEMQQRLGVNEARFFACGLSLVIHPHSPMIPTVHANFRYFELYDAQGERVDCWFGGGADLTPYYLWPEDAVHFHRSLKTAADRFHPAFYPRYKAQCDTYFFNTHRNEARGIGGMFYDYLRAGQDEMSEADWCRFNMAMGDSFLPAYVPIVERRKAEPWTETHKTWQEIRRGRYVEFNLVHDRGTLFGLRTNGRTESILMSLPPTVRWVYDHQPEPGTPEAELLTWLEPRDWVAATFQTEGKP
jgi:coproporphyrinogen III oxidase